MLSSNSLKYVIILEVKALATHSHRRRNCGAYGGRIPLRFQLEGDIICRVPLRYLHTEVPKFCIEVDALC